MLPSTLSLFLHRLGGLGHMGSPLGQFCPVLGEMCSLTSESLLLANLLKIF